MAVRVNPWRLHGVAALAKKAADLDRKALEASKRASKAREALEAYLSTDSLTVPASSIP